MLLLLSSALACDVANITGPQLVPHSYSLVVIMGGTPRWDRGHRFRQGSHQAVLLPKGSANPSPRNTQNNF
jgi:hypothetical protein